MDEIKQEDKPVEIPTNKETYSKEEVEALINKKISDTFGDLLKEINKPKPATEEKPKEKTLDDLLF